MDKQNAVKVGMSMGEDKETRREESNTNKSAGCGGGGVKAVRSRYYGPTREARRRRGICACRGGKKARAHNNKEGKSKRTQRGRTHPASGISRLSFAAN